MSLLTGEVVPSGLNANEPPRPLATLPVYNKQIEHLENQDAATCERELSGFKNHLRQLRVTNKATNWNWALPIVDAPEEAREEFFAALTRLLERQQSTVVRVRIFALLLELSAVELAPPAATQASGMVSDKSSTNPSSSAAGWSFGYHALRIVTLIMPNVVGARDLFVACVEDPLIEVLASMSMQHLISLFPLLLDILTDPYFKSMILTSPETPNVFSLFAKTSEVFKKVFLLLLEKVRGPEGLSRPDARNLVFSLQQCGRVLAVIAQSPITAEAIHGDGVFSSQVFKEFTLLKRLDADERWSGDSSKFTFVLLIARMCRGSLGAAAYFSGASPSQASTDIVQFLITSFKSIPDKPANDTLASLGPTNGGGNGANGSGGAGGPQAEKQEFNQDALNASILLCLSAMLMNSDRAAGLMKERKEGMKTPKQYYTSLFKWLLVYEQGDFVSACVESITALTKHDRLKTFRSAMEDRAQLCLDIQKTFKRLLIAGSGTGAGAASSGGISVPKTRAHREALLHALELMTYYSLQPKIASGLNHTSQPAVDGWDRLSVLKKLLRYPGESQLVDNDVKLAAARCLSQVSMNDLNAKVVQDVLDILKSLQSTMAPAMAACATRLLNIAFKMSLFDIDPSADPSGGGASSPSSASSSSSSSSSPATGPQENIGLVFRKAATEAFSALYATLDAGIVDDRTPLRLDNVTSRFRLAILKVLMSSWQRPELRLAAESKAAMDVLVKSLRAEQNALRWCKARHIRLVNSGRCVDCEEELAKNGFAQPQRALTGPEERPAPGSAAAAAAAASAASAASTIASAAHGGDQSITNVLAAIRCPRCKDNPAKGQSVIQQTYTPLYLEQTWSGADIKTILDTLKKLKEVDLVAFRVLHQAANILEGTTYARCVDRLLAHKDFETWNRDLPGRGVKSCLGWERQSWSLRQARLRRAEQASHPVLQAERWMAPSLGMLQTRHMESLYGFKEPSRDTQGQAQFLRKVWEEQIARSQADGRLVQLVVLGAYATSGSAEVRAKAKREAPLLAAICGGPLRESSHLPPATGGGFSIEQSGPHAEVYGLYVSSSLSPAENRSVSLRLLAEISSSFFRLGYTSCFSRTHRAEATLFSVAQALNFDSEAHRKSHEKLRSSVGAQMVAAAGLGANEESINGCSPSLTTAGRDKLYAWGLQENIWRFTPSHDAFRRNNGIRALIDFVLPGTIKIAQLFSSTIRGSMEEFGEELQDALNEHQEAMKPALAGGGGGAVRAGGGGGGGGGGGHKDDDDHVGGGGDGHTGGEHGDGSSHAINKKDNHKKSKGVKGNTRLNIWDHTLVLDWSTGLPPPLPSDAFELGDSPLGASGLLSILNADKDHLYKHLFPLMLQNRFRAAGVEHNRSEESPWSQSLLGSPQENLLSVAANHTSAASVFDETTWQPRVETSKKGKKKPSASSSSAAAAAAAGAGGAAAEAGAAGATSFLPPSPGGSLSEAELLKHQAEGSCAAIFRAFYTLVVSGSLSVRVEVARLLRTPENFYKLRCLMSSFQYGIRSSILMPKSPPYLAAMTCNFLVLMEELLPASIVGLEDGLATLEVLEVFLLVIQDLFSSLLSLLRSRNEHARDPMHAQRRLSHHEEIVLETSTRLCYLLVSKASQVTLFAAEEDLLARANIESRAKAIHELLLRDKPLFLGSLFSFLLYDLEPLPPLSEAEEDELESASGGGGGGEDGRDPQEEMAMLEAGVDPSVSTAKLPPNNPFGPQSLDDSDDLSSMAAITARAGGGSSFPSTRESMRIHVCWLLSSLFHVAPALQRDFLHQYHLTSSTMDLGLRPSLMHSIIASQQQLIARDKLYQVLLRRGGATPLLQSDEFIIDHVMCEWHCSSRLVGTGITVLLQTNLGYHVSSKPLTPFQEGWAWLDDLKLSRRNYSDIRGVGLIYGGGGLMLSRYSSDPVSRLRSGFEHVEDLLEHDVFIIPQMGLAQRIAYNFQRERRDDYGCPIPLGQTQN